MVRIGIVTQVIMCLLCSLQLDGRGIFRKFTKTPESVAVEIKKDSPVLTTTLVAQAQPQKKAKKNKSSKNSKKQPIVAATKTVIDLQAEKKMLEHQMIAQKQVAIKERNEYAQQLVQEQEHKRLMEQQIALLEQKLLETQKALEFYSAQQDKTSKELESVLQQKYAKKMYKAEQECHIAQKKYAQLENRYKKLISTTALKEQTFSNKDHEISILKQHLTRSQEKVADLERHARDLTCHLNQANERKVEQQIFARKSEHDHQQELFKKEDVFRHLQQEVDELKNEVAKMQITTDLSAAMRENQLQQEATTCIQSDQDVVQAEMR